MDEEHDPPGPNPEPSDEKPCHIGSNEASDCANSDPGSKMVQHLESEPNGKATGSDENESSHGSGSKEDSKTGHNSVDEETESASFGTNGVDSAKCNDACSGTVLNRATLTDSSPDVRTNELNIPSPDSVTAADSGSKQNESPDLGSIGTAMECGQKHTSPNSDTNKTESGLVSLAVISVSESNYEAPQHLETEPNGKTTRSEENESSHGSGSKEDLKTGHNVDEESESASFGPNGVDSAYNDACPGTVLNRANSSPGLDVRTNEINSPSLDCVTAADAGSKQNESPDLGSIGTDMECEEKHSPNSDTDKTESGLASTAAIPVSETNYEAPQHLESEANGKATGSDENESSHGSGSKEDSKTGHNSVDEETESASFGTNGVGSAKCNDACSGTVLNRATLTDSSPDVRTNELNIPSPDSVTAADSGSKQNESPDLGSIGTDMECEQQHTSPNSDTNKAESGLASTAAIPVSETNYEAPQQLESELNGKTTGSDENESSHGSGSKEDSKTGHNNVDEGTESASFGPNGVDSAHNDVSLDTVLNRANSSPGLDVRTNELNSSSPDSVTAADSELKQNENQDLRSIGTDMECEEKHSPNTDTDKTKSGLASLAVIPVSESNYEAPQHLELEANGKTTGSDENESSHGSGSKEDSKTGHNNVDEELESANFGSNGVDSAKCNDACPGTVLYRATSSPGLDVSNNELNSPSPDSVTAVDTVSKQNESPDLGSIGTDMECEQQHASPNSDTNKESEANGKATGSDENESSHGSGSKEDSKTGHNSVDEETESASFGTNGVGSAKCNDACSGTVLNRATLTDSSPDVRTNELNIPSPDSVTAADSGSKQNESPDLGSIGTDMECEQQHTSPNSDTNKAESGLASTAAIPVSETNYEAPQQLESELNGKTTGSDENESSHGSGSKEDSKTGHNNVDEGTESASFGPNGVDSAHNDVSLDTVLNRANSSPGLDVRTNELNSSSPDSVTAADSELKQNENQDLRSIGTDMECEEKHSPNTDTDKTKSGLASLAVIPVSESNYEAPQHLELEANGKTTGSDENESSHGSGSKEDSKTGHNNVDEELESANFGSNGVDSAKCNDACPGTVLYRATSSPGLDVSTNELNSPSPDSVTAVDTVSKQNESPDLGSIGSDMECEQQHASPNSDTNKAESGLASTAAIPVSETNYEAPQHLESEANGKTTGSDENESSHGSRSKEDSKTGHNNVDEGTESASFGPNGVDSAHNDVSLDTVLNRANSSPGLDVRTNELNSSSPDSVTAAESELKQNENQDLRSIGTDMECEEKHSPNTDTDKTKSGLASLAVIPVSESNYEAPQHLESEANGKTTGSDENESSSGSKEDSKTGHNNVDEELESANFGSNGVDSAYNDVSLDTVLNRANSSPALDVRTNELNSPGPDSVTAVDSELKQNENPDLGSIGTDMECEQKHTSPNSDTNKAESGLASLAVIPVSESNYEAPQHLESAPNGKTTGSDENESSHGSGSKEDSKTGHNNEDEDSESASFGPNGVDSAYNDVSLDTVLNRANSSPGLDVRTNELNSPSPDSVTAADSGSKQNESPDLGSIGTDMECEQQHTSPNSDTNKDESGLASTAAIPVSESNGAFQYDEAKHSLGSSKADPETGIIASLNSESSGASTSGLKAVNSGPNDAKPMCEQSAGSSGLYRPPSMRRQDMPNTDGPKSSFAALSTPTFQQYNLQRQKENKKKDFRNEPFNRRNTSEPKTRWNQRSDQRFNSNRNNYQQRKHQQNTYARIMTCDMLAEIAKSGSVVIIEKINKEKESFQMLLESAFENSKHDVFALVFELVTNVWSSSFEESKKLLLLEICNSKFIDHLQLYLMQLPYVTIRNKSSNKHYWTRENEFWNNFMNFCEYIIDVSPSTAVRKCGALIEASSQSCLDGLKEKHRYELPTEYTARMTEIRDRIRKKEESQKKSNISSLEPPESFRELSVLPTGSELVRERAFVRPNVVEGGYADVEHYLDVQFRLLREDCFGPLRDGIQQYIEDPKKRKYDNIRVYHNVKFQRPHYTKQHIGSLVLLDKSTERMFRNIDWKQSKKFMFGSLVLFTKDNCKSFLVGTVMERDEEYLSKRLLGVSIIDSKMESDLYNGDLYTMMECEVYFEPYYHVLKALQDPGFPDQLAMSYYIVHVQKEIESPEYVDPYTEYIVDTNEENEFRFSVLQDETWPSQTQLQLDDTQYEAYKLALTREFAVIQGPPGTGKTYLGVKIARTLLDNARFPFPRYTCTMLVICYTNHALDQFLEAMLPITDSIARIGGRSQSERLELYNLKNLRGRDHFPERERLQRYICELENTSKACSNDVLLSCNTIVAYVKECTIVRDFYASRDAVKHWLFENVLVEFETVLDDHDENEMEVNNEEVQKSKEVDDDIYARDVLDLDDSDDEWCDWRFRNFTESTISFSLSEAENEINELTYKCQNDELKLQYKETKIKNLLDERKDLLSKGEKPLDYNNIMLRIRNSLKRLESDILEINNQLQNRQKKIVQLQMQVNIFKDMMVYQSRAPTIKLADVKDISKVPLIERWSLYFKWARITKVYLKKAVKEIEKCVKFAAEAYEEARMIADLRVLSETRVIGMTTTAAARLRKMLVAISPPIVVVEEAAEVLEAHIVTALTRNCQHLILIGDHQQLRPSAACVRLARQFGLEVSLFERMVRNGVRSRRLGVQHRMRPEFAALLTPHIYPNLRNHPSVEDFPPVRGVAHNLFFFSHNHMEHTEEDNNIRTNTQEANLTLCLANYLIQQGYKPEEVTILAAYSGQMFYMRRRRPLYDHLSEVKITVLDNYQGEESKIILLSLVRNNTNDSIGFLGTENRICVALSRAKEGFFMFGNIELLKRNSTLWTKIAETLASNGSLGSSLKLKCENHDDHFTMISSPEDFAKVPEGGCLLDCKYKMPKCGHPCPRKCHTYNLDHAYIVCTRNCERNICDIEGHNCPLNCGTECKPCQRLVEKVLPCSHTRFVRCHMPPDDPFIFCDVPVTVTLPTCGHETRKPCSGEISGVKCVASCENSRLSCGHTCTWNCHVKDDPNHLRYTCTEPCPKSKKGCKATLEGDLGDHKCPLQCSEQCQACDVPVTKKRSGCKHSKRVACHEDVDSEPCREKCARALPCGHHCKKLCFEPCGDCKQKVKKTITDCNHEIQIECRMEATRELCRKKCERIMSCGHACPARCDEPCDEPCDQTKCKEITERSSEAPCGHDVKLPCNVYQAMEKDAVAPRLLLSLCSAPCGALLTCGHVCGGSCSGCHQGRLHAPCAARCHQLLICGHRCEEPCSQVCPPCRKPCEVRCEHSRCSRACGAPCIPCVEQCSRACPHSSCTRVCGALCSRGACGAACARRLACGHACRGLCGERCPPVCRACRPDTFPTDLLGDPYKDDDKLIQLQDCPHILDVNALDTLMKNENHIIQIKTCPFCQVPIINTYRYKDLINETLKNEIIPIKEKVHGTDRQRREMLLELNWNFLILSINRLDGKLSGYWANACNVIRSGARKITKAMSVLQLDMYHIYTDILIAVLEYNNKKFDTLNVAELDTAMKKQIELICEALVVHKLNISQQLQSDIWNEMKRMNSIIQLSKMLKDVAAKPEVLEMSQIASEAVLTWRVFDEDKAVECLKKLEEALGLSGIVGKEERTMVVRGIGPKAGHWLKCPEGHFYCIAVRGVGMLSVCPECGARAGHVEH